LELATGSEQTGQTELLLTFAEDETRQSVGVPDAGLVLFLTMPQSTQGGTQPWVQVLESGSGQFIFEQNAPDGAPLTVGGVSFVLTPVPCARVQVTHDPGIFWSQLGLVVLLAGLVLWGRWPPRRLWLWRMPSSDNELGRVRVAGDVQGLVRLDDQDE
jgi:cytochrome c biogenesis protein ResB